MNPSDFDHFCRTLRERSGLSLGPDKAYLVRNRLDPIARAAVAAGCPGCWGASGGD